MLQKFLRKQSGNQRDRQQKRKLGKFDGHPRRSGTQRCAFPWRKTNHLKNSGELPRSQGCGFLDQKNPSHYVQYGGWKPTLTKVHHYELSEEWDQKDLESLQRE